MKQRDALDMAARMNEQAPANVRYEVAETAHPAGANPSLGGFFVRRVASTCRPAPAPAPVVTTVADANEQLSLI